MGIIKFRMWNPSSNSYLHDVENVFECLMQQIVNDKTMSTRGFKVPYNHREDGIIWEQFTGLKDKNGVEIYEGDIVKVEDGYLKYGFASGENYEVYFNYGGFRLKPKYNEKAKGHWVEDGSYLEVIGNIHENPELI